MKKIVLLFTIAFSIHVFGQNPTPNLTVDSLYTAIIPVDSTSQDQLFSRAKIFATTKLSSGTSITDEQSHTLILKGRLNRFYVNPLNKSLGGAVNFTIKIATKPGKYRYEITNLYHSDVHPNGDFSGGSLSNMKPACGGLFMTKRNWEKIKEDTNKQLQQLIQDLYAAMTSSPNDGW